MNKQQGYIVTVYVYNIKNCFTMKKTYLSPESNEISCVTESFIATSAVQSRSYPAADGTESPDATNWGNLWRE